LAVKIQQQYSDIFALHIAIKCPIFSPTSSQILLFFPDFSCQWEPCGTNHNRGRWQNVHWL